MTPHPQARATEAAAPKRAFCINIEVGLAVRGTNGNAGPASNGARDRSVRGGREGVNIATRWRLVSHICKR